MKEPCEFCDGTLALYAETNTTKLYINTKNGARAIYTSTKPSTCPENALCALKGVENNSAFIINFCPNCGRDLRKSQDFTT